ncbi:MAG: TPM domain-containing protein [Planctomycetes bacterium]|nr:TPM domain-containing protein [Planctomycetota bacterium]
MHCPHCAKDLNDDHPACPECKFHISDLDAELGAPPERQGDVLDRAGVLTPDERERLVRRCADLRARTGAELVVVTAASSAPRKPCEHAFWLFNRWEVGGAAHAGILVLLSLAERRVESEVGVALEEIISDAASGALLEAHAVPFFALGSFGEGLYQAVDVLAQLVEHAPRKAWA